MSAVDVPHPLPRAIADAYLDAYVELNPFMATELGLEVGRDRLPDLSPDGAQAMADLARRTLAQLDASEAAGGSQAEQERRCARLLRERLSTGLALHDAKEHLRAANTFIGPAHRLRSVFTVMPVDDEEDWLAVAARLRAVPEALAGYRACLETGLAQGLPAGPLQISANIRQFTQWVGEAGGDGGSWFTGFGGRRSRVVEPGTAGSGRGGRRRLRGAARLAARQYVPRSQGTPDGVGRSGTSAGPPLDRRRTSTWPRRTPGAGPSTGGSARRWTPRREKVLPGAAPLRGACATSDEHGPAVEGVEQIRERLQEMMDEAIDRPRRHPLRPRRAACGRWRR